MLLLLYSLVEEKLTRLQVYFLRSLHKENQAFHYIGSEGLVDMLTLIGLPH